MFDTRKRIRIALVLCAGVLMMALSPRAAAQERNKRTVFTFSEPVEIPGKVLPAGTYVFKLLASTGSKNIVQIYDKGETELIATVVAIPDYREEATSETVVHFEEQAAGAPEAIKTWFYPGDNYGLQFVYPHERAMALAKRTNGNVLSMADEMAPNMSAGAKSESDSSVQQLEGAEVTAVNPSGKQVDSSQAATPAKKKQQ